MIIDESRSMTGESPPLSLIIGGVASCTVFLVMTIAVMCCLGLRRNANTAHSTPMTKFRKCLKCHQVECRCIRSSTAQAPEGTSDTIKSVQVSSNPAYTTNARQLDSLDQKPDNLYTSLERLDEDNFEYMALDVEQEILAVTSPTLVSPPSAVPAPALLTKGADLDNQGHVSDEDEEGYVTYNPKEPPFEAHQIPEMDSNQIYENTVSKSLPVPGRRHGYVNDVQRLVQEIEAERKNEELERCDSYCDMNDIQAKIEEDQLEELDKSLYVNNLDALVQAAKQLEASQGVKPRAATSLPHTATSLKEPVDHRPYVNDLFLSVQQTLKEERTSKRQEVEPEDLYVNSISYSKLPHRH